MNKLFTNRRSSTVVESSDRQPRMVKPFLFFIILLSAIIVSCKKFVTVEPPKTQIVTATVYSSDASAISAISGIYSRMMSSSGLASGNLSSITVLGGLSSDELINYSNASDKRAFYTNSLLPTNSDVKNSLWGEGYMYIYFANSVLEGLAASQGKVTESIKKQLEGEAKFIRAFSHFYLTNLFGDIPIITTTNYRINNAVLRQPKDAVYQQIILDLIDAQNLLSDDYSFSEGQRVRPNKAVATSLLARTYLYNGKWSEAESQATAIINNSMFSLVANLNEIFLANSSEAIWQLKPVIVGLNTNEGNIFILESTPQSVSLSNSVLNAFEVNDNREINWVNSLSVGGGIFYFPYKYKIKTDPPEVEYSMVLRLAELYLIRAEARAQQNNINGAQNDVNAIRTRAGLGNTIANDKSSLLSAIEQERRVELFSEWGHRWLDLKRWNRADAVLGPIKASNWQPTDVLYPIPQTERNNNPNLSQNQGY